MDLRWAELEIDHEVDGLERVRRSAEAAAASYMRALTAAARAERRAASAPGGGLRASRAELLRRRGELRHRLDRVADLAFPSPCEAAPLAFAFAAARETLTAIDRLAIERLRRARGGNGRAASDA